MNTQFKMNLLRVLIVALSFIYASQPYAQDRVQLLPLQSNDLAADQLQAAPKTTLMNDSRDDVFFSWPLQAYRPLNEIAKTHRASSKHYWLNTDGNRLKRGVKFQTTAPGAIVKLSPRTDKRFGNIVPTLNTSQISIIDSRGKRHSQQSALARSATSAQLSELAAPFSQGTIIFQLNEDLGHGEFTIKTNDLSGAQQPFTLYVLDKNSDYALSVHTENDTVFTGHPVLAEISLEKNRHAQTINHIEAYLLSPDGEKYIIDNKTIKQGYIEAKKIIDTLDSEKIGLWELHAIVQSTINGSPMQRNAKTSFSYTQPNAALEQTVDVYRNQIGNKKLMLSFGVNAVSSGRFELRGTLFATDSNNQRVPIMVANTAGWLDIGSSTLTLKFDLEKITAKTLKPPFEIRDLRLLDQSRMMLLHRQQKALQF